MAGFGFEASWCPGWFLPPLYIYTAVSTSWAAFRLWDCFSFGCNWFHQCNCMTFTLWHLYATCKPLGPCLFYFVQTVGKYSEPKTYNLPILSAQFCGFKWIYIVIQPFTNIQYPPPKLFHHLWKNMGCVTSLSAHRDHMNHLCFVSRAAQVNTAGVWLSNWFSSCWFLSRFSFFFLSVTCCMICQ